MSYSEEAVKAKLSSLNETQESIVTVAQWIMFHRRHADRTASLWLQRLENSNTAKRLNLVYLANEVVQQSRARQKNDFLLAFEPLISDATSLAYKSASQEVQQKLRRVVEVWRQRNIFDPSIQSATEARLKELDDARGGGGVNGSSGGRKLGGSLFGGSGSVPAELDAATKALGGLSKADASVKPAVDKANEEYAKMTDPDYPIPTAPLHAAKLAALMKHLAAAQGAVEASMTARTALLKELEKLVTNHQAKLTEDETTMTDLMARKEGIEAKKREVEDNIMRGLSTPTSPENVATPDNAGSEDRPPNGTEGKKRSGSKEVERPEAEGFTPPPPDVESFTPPAQQQQDMETETGDPAPIFDEENQDALITHEDDLTSTTGAERIQEHPPNFNEPAPAFEPPPALSLSPTPPGLPPQSTAFYSPVSAAEAAANDFLNNLNVNTQKQSRRVSSESPAAVNGSPTDPRLKRRKLSHKDDGDDEMRFLGGVDEEGVSALLNG